MSLSSVSTRINSTFLRLTTLLGLLAVDLDLEKELLLLQEALERAGIAVVVRGGEKKVSRVGGLSLLLLVTGAILQRYSLREASDSRLGRARGRSESCKLKLSLLSSSSLAASLKMSVRSLQSLRALAAQATTAAPQALRYFSSSAPASTSKLSPLNKTTIARQQRAARGAGKHSKAKEADTLPLEEAAKVLQVSYSSFTPPSLLLPTALSAPS
jgi:hypothetical protein